MALGPSLLALSISVAVLLLGEGARAHPAPVEISLRGAYRTEPSGLRELLGTIELTIPFDRTAAPPRMPSLADDTQGYADAERSPDATPSTPAPRQREVTLVLTSELVRSTLRAAFKTAGYGAAARRLDSLAGRARSSAILPALSLKAARSLDESLRLSPTASDPYRYTQAGGAGLLFEARVAWRLDRLLFADEELVVERLRGQKATARTRLIERVLKVLFAWQRAKVVAEDATLEPAARLDAMLDELEAALTLDVLTDGWFARVVLAPKVTTPKR